MRPRWLFTAGREGSRETRGPTWASGEVAPFHHTAERRDTARRRTLVSTARGSVLGLLTILEVEAFS